MSTAGQLLQLATTGDTIVHTCVHLMMIIVTRMIQVLAVYSVFEVVHINAMMPIDLSLLQHILQPSSPLACLILERVIMLKLDIYSAN